MALAGRKNEQDGRILGWWLVTRIEMDAVPRKIWLWGRINPWPSVDHATEPSRHLVQSRGKAPEPALEDQSAKRIVFRIMARCSPFLGPFTLFSHS